MSVSETTGIEALCVALADSGVRHVFGLPGTQNADLFSAFPRFGIRTILANHETSAAFMANGYARASGRPAVLATIPGPGFAFSVPGIAEASLDSVPLLHIVNTPATGRRFAHQAIDQATMMAPVLRRVVEVKERREVGTAVREAFRWTTAGEPGPVMLHMSPRALSGGVREDTSPMPLSDGAPRTEDRSRWEGELRELVGRAERPAFFLGGGALGCERELRGLIEELAAPVFTTLTARGIVPEDHPQLFVADPERTAVGQVNELLEKSDLVIALGCKFSHNGTGGFRLQLARERLVHVNSDPEALGATYPARLEVCAQVADVLPAIRAGVVDPDASRKWPGEEWRAWKAAFEARSAPRYPEPSFGGISDGSASGFFSLLRETLPADSIVVTDAGLHQTMTRRYYTVLRGRGLIVPSDFQSMGFGLPAAIGAALGAPERPVVAVVGDGGMLMSAMDLVCALRERIGVSVIVFNDGYLNQIRLQQLQDSGLPAGVRLKTPDLQGLAAALGVKYGLLGAQAGEVIRRSVSEGTPWLLEVPLGDSAAIRALQAKATLKRSVRGALGPNLWGGLKSLIRRRGGDGTKRT